MTQKINKKNDVEEFGAITEPRKASSYIITLKNGSQRVTTDLEGFKSNYNMVGVKVKEVYND